MIGEYRVVSLWFNGDEQKAKAQTVLQAMLLSDELKAGVVLGPVEFEVIGANDPRLEGRAPPESGAQVLLAAAQVLDFKTTVEDAGFLANLDEVSLERLRKATRRAYRAANPGGSPITQDQLDRMIGRLGPEVAARLVRH